MQPVWLMCLSPEAEQGSDYSLHVSDTCTTCLPFRIIPAGTTYSQKVQRNERETTKQVTRTELTKGEEKVRDQIALPKATCHEGATKGLGKTVSMDCTSSYHYHPHLLCFMTHYSTSLALEQTQKRGQRLALTCSSVPSRSWARIDTNNDIDRKSKMTMKPHRPGRFWLLISDMPLWQTKVSMR